MGQNAASSRFAGRFGLRAEVERVFRTVHFHSRDKRTEIKRRRDIVGDLQFANFLEVLEIPVHALQHGFLIFFAEAQARQFEGAPEHFGRDAGLTFLLHFGP